MPELRVVSAAETAALRSEVLRGGGPLPPATTPPDLELGLYDGQVLLATGNIRREPAPWAADVPAWRIRGMATKADRRGEGLGGQILLALLQHAEQAGVGTATEHVWCNARTPAQSFYERAGFETVGERWEDPEIGPHIQMVRRG